MRGQHHVRAALCVVTLAAASCSPERATMADDSETHLRSLIGALPESAEGWRKGATEVYGPTDLFSYINGGAELYISFQFRALISQPYVRDDGAEVRLDIFDMGSAASAFGVFSHSREGIDNFIAADIESEYAGGLLTFWKGPYYASILAYPETESKRDLVRRFARLVAAQIDEPSPRPAVVGRLPETGLVPYSIRYFRHHVWLNEYHPISEANLLDLDGRAEAAMARYRMPDSESRPAVLVAIAYPSVHTAETAHRQFTAALLPGAKDGLMRTDDGTWLGCRRADDLVVVVAGAADREAAAGLLETCALGRAEQETGKPR
jgi:hypothetical protein